MSRFDGLSNVAFKTVQSTFSDVAIWNPSNGSDQITDKVLFNNVENNYTLGDVEKSNYSPYKFWFEFYDGSFPGLKLLVDSGNLETVQINGTSYDVQDVTTSKFDGKNFIAYCELHE